MAKQRFRITLESIYGLTTTTARGLNVFYYQERDDSGGTSTDLLGGFIIQVMDIIAGQIIVDSVGFSQVTVVNLDNPLDFTDNVFSPPTGGARTGQPMPPFVAWEFQYIRGSLASRHGWKRFMGPSESDVESGVATSGMTTPLANVASALRASVVGGDSQYDPFIARRPAAGQPLSATVLFPIANVVYRRVTSQNTRKFGRGF